MTTDPLAPVYPIVAFSLWRPTSAVGVYHCDDRRSTIEHHSTVTEPTYLPLRHHTNPLFAVPRNTRGRRSGAELVLRFHMRHHPPHNRIHTPGGDRRQALYETEALLSPI